MVRIGVTGRMGSGKSTVARRFQEKGATLVDGDTLGWEVLRIPDVREAITASMGPDVIDRGGQVDRARLGRVVFRDPGAMERLNGIVQPVLLRRVREVLEAPGQGVLVLDAAVLPAWVQEFPLWFYSSSSETAWSGTLPVRSIGRTIFSMKAISLSESAYFA